MLTDYIAGAEPAKRRVSADAGDEDLRLPVDTRGTGEDDLPVGLQCRAVGGAVAAERGDDVAAGSERLVGTAIGVQTKDARANRRKQPPAAAVDEAVDQVLDGLAPLVAEALAKAFVTFAAEHPDAPRAREAVPA